MEKVILENRTDTMAVTINILGIEGHYKTKHLKSNVLVALQELNLEAEVIEISDIHQLMKSDIMAIPALRINGKTVSQQTIPNVEELILILKVMIQPDIKSPSMKQLLVPTDFSETAIDTFKFAQQLAEKNESAIKVLHIFDPQVDPAFPYLGNASTQFYQEKGDLLAEFTEANTITAQNTSPRVAINIHQEIRMGKAKEAIVNVSTEPGVDMIVMGTTGESGFLEKVFGTVSSHVARQAHCPVLLVPKGSQFKSFKKVLYASNYQTNDEVMLNRLVEFANLFNSEIHFVHIQEDKQKRYVVNNVYFEQIFRREAPGLGLNIVNITSVDVMEGLSRYAIENNIDLMVMATMHRSFIENIFHKSLTKQMSLATKIPLMVMHFDE